MTALKQTGKGGNKGRSQKTIVCGVGNSLRGDDGAGAYACQLIDVLHLPGVYVEYRQQLTPDALEDWLPYDAVIIVDASVTATEVKLSDVEEKMSPSNASSHHTDIAVLHALNSTLYDHQKKMLICEIPARQFNLGEPLSTLTQTYAHDAVTSIKTWIEGSRV